ncbi:MAG TPA: hypothetical protein VKQ72_07015, partial [Aggregatilineales bacterium]|nr:hypothetical protein [Aggregatilineales bacterium]
IMYDIVHHGLSWEEPVIGYWCRLERYPSMFQADFWRLLQAPYFKKSPRIQGIDHIGISPNSVVAEITEKFGDEAERIMRRYGLYCGGCHRATYETLALAGNQHGLEDKQIARLVLELNRVLN